MENVRSDSEKEWLEKRKNTIGASEIAAVIGASPWISTYQLWCLKTGRATPQKENYAMSRGKALENEARQAYIEMSDNIVSKEKRFIYEKWPIASATPDGITLDGDIIVEIKCPMSSSLLEQCKSKTIPEYYFSQIQWQLMCSHAKQVDFFCYYPNLENIFITFKSDKKYQNHLLEEAKKFWDLVEKDMPPATGINEYVLIEDRQFEDLAKQYIKMHAEEQELKKRKDLLKKTMVEFTDDGNCYGYGVKIRKNLGRKIIKWNKVCEKFNINDKDLRSFTDFGYSSYSVLIDKK